MSRAGAPFGRVRPGTARERKAHCAFMLVCAQSFSFDLVSARAACLCSAHDLAIASCCCSCSCFALALALALHFTSLPRVAGCSTHTSSLPYSTASCITHARSEPQLGQSGWSRRRHEFQRQAHARSSSRQGCIHLLSHFSQR